MISHNIKKPVDSVYTTGKIQVVVKTAMIDGATCRLLFYIHALAKNKYSSVKKMSKNIATVLILGFV